VHGARDEIAAEVPKLAVNRSGFADASPELSES
jgi:hypothetical protein